MHHLNFGHKLIFGESIEQGYVRIKIIFLESIEQGYVRIKKFQTDKQMPD